MFPVFVQIGKDPSSVHFNAIRFTLIFGFVVEGEGLVLPFLAGPAEEDCSRVAQICAEELVVVKIEQTGGSAGEVYVDA